jgi:hypothetical protein
MTGMLSMFSQSARSVDVLDQHLALQRQLRFAAEAIKRDLRLTGFLSTPNSKVDSNQCPDPVTTPGVYVMRALSLELRNGYVHAPSVNVNISPTSISIFGDFSGGQSFKTREINVGSDTVVLLDGDSVPKTEDEWNLVFRDHRILRVTNPEQYDFYLPIEQSDFSSKTIRLDGSIPEANPPDNCGVLGFGAGYNVNINHYVRYRIIKDPRERSRTVLVREELAADGQTPVESTRMIIGENIVDLQFYDFIFDMGPANAPDLKRAATVSDMIDGDVVADPSGGGLLGFSGFNNHPEHLRALTIKVTSCARKQDSDMLFQPRRNPSAPIYSYKLNEQMSGAVRCMSAASRVQLRSLMVRNLKAESN